LKIIALSILLAMLGGAASASQLRCGYDSNGNGDGADGGTAGVPEAQWDLPYAIPSPDHAAGKPGPAYAIILSSYNSGNDCPAGPVEVRSN